MVEVLSCPIVVSESFESGSSFLIRHARLSDLKSLIELWIEQRQYHFSIDSLYTYNSESIQIWSKYIRKALNSNNQCVFVATSREGCILGYIDGAIYPWPLSPYKKYGSVNTISVTKAVWSQGVGTRLIEKLMSWFKEQNVNYVSLHVDFRNHRALKLYYSLGFRPYQQRLISYLRTKEIPKNF